MKDAYLLDTSIASIAWDGGHSKHLEVRSRLAALGDVSISVCAITIAEVLYGLCVSPSIDRQRHDAVRQALQQYHVWDVDRHTAGVYAPIRGRLFELYAPRDRKGRLTTKQPEDLLDRTTGKELGIQENDLWIVSVAVQYDLCFLTGDKKMRRILDVAKDIHGYDRALVWEITS